MKALKCDFCAGNLIIDDSREFAVCEFCGTKYMASTLRKKIQEIKGTVKVEGAVETITGEAEKERQINNANILLNLGKYDDARKQLSTITNQFPDDYRGWWLMYSEPFIEFINDKDKLGFPSIDYSKQLEIAFKLHNLTNEYNSLWDNVARAYFLKHDNPNFCFGDLFKDKQPQIPNNAFASIKNDAQSKLDFSDKVVKYLDSIKYTMKIRTMLVSHGVKCNKYFLKKLRKQDTYTSYTFHKYINGILIIYDHGWDSTRKDSYSLTKPFTFVEIGLCQYCGGEFKGILSKVCSKCGKPKDY